MDCRASPVGSRECSLRQKQDLRSSFLFCRLKTLLFHVDTFQVGGIEKVLIELLRALDPSRYRIRLSIAYDFGAHEVLRGELPDYVEVHHLLKHPLLNYTQRRKKTGTITVAEKLLGELIFPPIRKAAKRRELKKLLADTDVVIDFDTTLSAFADLFAGKRSAAYCHFSFTQIWNGSARKLDRLVSRLSRYDRVVMLCDEMKTDTAALYPALAPKLVRIYNALDQAHVLARAREPEDFVESLGNAYIVAVGRLHEAQKDFTTLLKSYIRCVSEYGIKQDLVIVGFGEARPMLEALAAAAGLSHRVHFTGFQQNPYKWIAAADMLLFSSKYEGLPTVIIEAHLLGVPVVATVCPTGVRELLADGKAGILVPVGDVGAMAAATHRMLSDVSLRPQIREAVRGILYQFTSGYMVGEFERLLVD